MAGTDKADMIVSPCNIDTDMLQMGTGDEWFSTDITLRSWRNVRFHAD
ncbi:hypothetical protein SAMN05216317_11432 [Nitrosomonas eutropha]|uniref:Uncharacterized protein n=1 Tax=Nitrosomonas eutropha TaxID=916 RepID=A0ABX5M3U1_9PROT|nr:hypothetical protein C8R14_13919 [Nitrosomonas eutropha]SDW82624.1 hypothetical protein SAMN05216317_11432 [Nitrosomonas eutropha]SEI99388.1 hypothetical protein SAMN05216318_11933 [Nitrosomonas eutropha]